MMMIRIPQQKVEDLSMNVEKMLKYGGMAMTCLSELMRENGMEPMYREPMSPNYRYPQHPQYREEMDEWEPEFRRGVKGTGRYSRY